MKGRQHKLPPVTRLRRFVGEALIELQAPPSSLGWLDTGSLGPVLLVVTESGVSVFARGRSGAWGELARHDFQSLCAAGRGGVLDPGFFIAALGRQLVSMSDTCRRDSRVRQLLVSSSLLPCDEHAHEVEAVPLPRCDVSM